MRGAPGTESPQSASEWLSGRAPALLSSGAANVHSSLTKQGHLGFGAGPVV
jgi:hypothetical protein